MAGSLRYQASKRLALKINNKCIYATRPLSPENFVKDSNNNLYLIDWEYSGLNDPAWDVAFLCTILLLDKDKEQLVCELYNREDPLLKSKVLLFKPIIHMGSVLWAYEQLQKEEAKLPTHIVNNIYLQRLHEVKRIMASEEYMTACKQLTNHNESYEYFLQK